jgi:hypothetical protein
VLVLRQQAAGVQLRAHLVHRRASGDRLPPDTGRDLDPWLLWVHAPDL